MATINDNSSLKMYENFQQVAKELAGVQDKQIEELEETDGVLDGANVTFEEDERQPVDKKGQGNPIQNPSRSVTEDLDLAEEISKRLKAASNSMKDSFASGDVKRYTGATHAMLKAAGVNITATTKAFFNIFTLMQLMLETAQQQRTAGREMRNAELLATTASIERQADKQIEAAVERRNAALVSAGVTIGMGAVSAIMSGIGGAKGASAGDLKDASVKFSNMADEVLGASDEALDSVGKSVGESVDDVSKNLSGSVEVKLDKPTDVLNNGMDGLTENNQQPQKVEQQVGQQIEQGADTNVEQKVENQVEQKVEQETSAVNPEKKMNLSDAENTVKEWLDGGGKGKPPSEVVKAAKMLKAASKVMKAQAQRGFNTVSNIKGVVEGLSSIGKGAGDIIAASLSMKSEMIQAEATREQVNQKFAEAAMQDAVEAMQTAQEVINTVIRAMLQVLTSQVEMMKQLHFA